VQDASGTERSGSSVLDEGLSRLAGTGPEFRGGLSNHGPMASEALVRLGRPDAVRPWLDRYVGKLDPAPRPAVRLSGDTWPGALGDLRRVADWEAYLRAQLAAEPWRDVLARWWPRLLPGVAAAATHGVIRTSHAARSLAAAEAAGGETGLRRDELARGLAYWAASYLALPGAPRTAGQRDLAAALAGLPQAGPADERGLITTQLAQRLPATAGFGAAVAALRPPADPAAGLRALATAFTRAFLGYGRTRPISLLHAVTAPVAARSVLPLLPEELARPTYDALWQVAAGLYAVYAAGLTPEPLPSGPAPSRDGVTDRAVAAADEHAIKLTEACLRLHAETPDPVFLHAAVRASELLGAG
jgi:Questin oxidase-like